MPTRLNYTTLILSSNGQEQHFSTRERGSRKLNKNRSDLIKYLNLKKNTYLEKYKIIYLINEIFVIVFNSKINIFIISASLFFAYLGGGGIVTSIRLRNDGLETRLTFVVHASCLRVSSGNNLMHKSVKVMSK